VHIVPSGLGRLGRVPVAEATGYTIFPLRGIWLTLSSDSKTRRLNGSQKKERIIKIADGKKQVMVIIKCTVLWANSFQKPEDKFYLSFLL